MLSFLVDEDLSPALCEVAYEQGYMAHAVVHRGWAGRSDAYLFQRALAEHLVIVTNNGADFRSLVGAVELHPGLVIIVESVRRAEQQRLFGLALATIRTLPDMVNRVVEVTTGEQVEVYYLPDILQG